MKVIGVKNLKNIVPLYLLHTWGRRLRNGFLGFLLLRGIPLFKMFLLCHIFPEKRPELIVLRTYKTSWMLCVFNKIYNYYNHIMRNTCAEPQTEGRRMKKFGKYIPVVAIEILYTYSCYKIPLFIKWAIYMNKYDCIKKN